MQILNLPVINSENTCYLYHVRHTSDKGDLRKGYVGISKNPVERIKQHHRQPNRMLRGILDSRCDVECELISMGADQEILRMEEYLRPHRDIGWNIAKGGGKPPVGSHSGCLHSDNTKKRISEAKKGKCGGVNHPLFGKKHKLESRVKQSKAKMGKRFSRNITTCNHCGKSGGSNMMFRYHHDNCSHFMINNVLFDNITQAMNELGFAEKTIRTYCSSKNKPKWFTVPRNDGVNENEE